MLKIYLAKISKLPSYQRGFSLIEILVALALVSLFVMLIPTSQLERDHENMKDATLLIRRAIQLTQDEAILGHKMARLSFKVSEDEQTYPFDIQLAQDSSLLLMDEVDIDKLSQKEREEWEKKRQDFDAQFQSVSQLDVDTLPEGIEFMALGDSNGKLHFLEESLSFYFFPSGERDEVILFLSNFSEVVTIETSSIDRNIEINFIALDTTQDTQDQKPEIIQKEYEKWLKK